MTCTREEGRKELGLAEVEVERGRGKERGGTQGIMIDDGSQGRRKTVTVTVKPHRERERDSNKD